MLAKHWQPVHMSIFQDSIRRLVSLEWNEWQTHLYRDAFQAIPQIFYYSFSTGTPSTSITAVNLL